MCSAEIGNQPSTASRTAPNSSSRWPSPHAHVAGMCNAAASAPLLAPDRYNDSAVAERPARLQPRERFPMAEISSSRIVITVGKNRPASSPASPVSEAGANVDIRDHAVRYRGHLHHVTGRYRRVKPDFAELQRPWPGSRQAFRASTCPSARGRLWLYVPPVAKRWPLRDSLTRACPAEPPRCSPESAHGLRRQENLLPASMTARPTGSRIYEASRQISSEAKPLPRPADRPHI